MCVPLVKFQTKGFWIKCSNQKKIGEKFLTKEETTTTDCDSSNHSTMNIKMRTYSDISVCLKTDEQKMHERKRNKWNGRNYVYARDEIKNL